MGDLVVTGWSQLSRNRREGELIARGSDPIRAAATIASTVEGLTTAPALARYLASRLGVELPITDAVTRLLAGEDPRDLIVGLMARPPERGVIVKSMRIPMGSPGRVRGCWTLAACGGSTNASSTGGRQHSRDGELRAFVGSVLSSRSTPTRRGEPSGTRLVSCSSRFPSAASSSRPSTRSNQADGVDLGADQGQRSGPTPGSRGLTADSSSVVLFTESPEARRPAGAPRKRGQPLAAPARWSTGWVVAGDTMAAVDRSRLASSNGSLADDSAFKDAVARWTPAGSRSLRARQDDHDLGR